MIGKATFGSASAILWHFGGTKSLLGGLAPYTQPAPTAPTARLSSVAGT